MAKGTNIGFLNFGIDGDDTEMMKKLKKIKEEAISIEQVFKDIKINTGGKAFSTDVQKAQLQADKLAISNNKVEESLHKVSKAEEQVSTERQRGAKIDEDAAAKRRQSLAQEIIQVKQASAIDQEQVRKDIAAKQRQIYEEERLSGLRKRNALIGVQGQRDLAAAYGLTNKTMFNQRNILQQLSSAMGIYFSIYQAGAFVKELAMVSGEFEKQRVSLAAIIGDAEAANRIFNQIKDLAVISPFNFKELTDYAKQLSAFSIPTNEIYDTTKRLADLSAGLGVDMSRIILAYGQVRSAAVLRGQELRQFTEAGIPLVDELAKKFSKLNGEVVTAGEVFDKISNRQVSFSMVKDIITELTSEGGKFFEMQELQSATLAGKISNLRDNYDMMLDSLGKANSGLLHGAMDGLVDVMDNWEKYWNILKGIIVTYGTYRTAIFLIAQGTTLAANAQKLYNTYLLMSSISGAKFGSVIDMMSVKFKSLDSVTKTTLVGGVIAAIVGIGYAIKTAYDESNKLEKSLSENFGKLKGSADASVFSLDNMLIRLKNAAAYSTEWNEIIKQINKSYGEYLPSLLKESDSYTDIESKIKGVTAAIYEKAKAQSYASSINIIEDELSSDLSKAYDSALKSLTDKPLLGFDQVILSKKEADEVIKQAFAAIKDSPELYREQHEVQKLVSGILSDAFKGRNVDTSIQGLLNYTQLDGLFKGVSRYAESWNSAAAAMNNAKEKNDIIYSQNDSYAKQIDLISQKYNVLAEEIDKTPLSNGFDIDKAKANNTTKMLSEMLDIYKQFGQFDLARGVEKQIESIKNMGSEWRKFLQEKLDKTITIQTDSNINSVVEEMEKKYKELKTRMDSQKPILLKLGFDFNTNTFPSPLNINSAQKALADSYIADNKDVENLDKAAQALGKTLKDLYEPKEKGEKKDKFTEDLKRQVDLIKSAKNEYDKLIKVITKQEAITKIKGISEYQTLGDVDLSDEGYIKYINEQLKKIEKRNTTSAKNVRLSWNKELGQIQIESIIKAANKASEKTEKELSQYKDQYSLYKYIFDKTGDKGQAVKMAFGDINAQVKTYRDALVTAIEKSTDPEQKKRFQEQLIDLDFTNTSDFTKRMTDLVAEFQSVDEQITLIKAKGEATRLEIEKNTDNASRDVVEKRLRANQESVNKQVSDLTNGVLQATDSYQRLFGDIADISQKELQFLIDKWKTALANATKNSAGNLIISIDGKQFETTEKEVANFTKRVLKSESELRKRNPFKTLLDGVDELRKNKSEIDLIKQQIEQLEAIRTAAQSDIDNGISNESTEHIVDGTTNRINNLKEELQNLEAQGATSLQKLGLSFKAVSEDVSAVSRSLSSMFDSLGKEDLADSLGIVSDLASAAGDIGTGLAAGNPVQVVQGIIGGITSIANFHDKKLDKAIRKSQIEVKRLQNVYENMSRFVDRQLGAISTKQAQQQIDNLKAQQVELRKQQAAEEDKKKKDKAAIEDYKASIAELGDQIAYFYEDLFNELYNFDFKSIADQISSALVDAFKSGEDAAKAFDNTVADIINKLASDMISLQIIQPSMEQLRNYLFGSNGVFMDGELSVTDAQGLVAQLANLKGSISDAKTIWDALNEAAEQAGVDLTDMSNSAKETLSKGIQSITEDTGNLIASYMNAMRADLAAQKQFIQHLVLLAQTHTDQFNLMYAELLRIQVNTLATANNTARNADMVTEIRDIMKRVTLPNSGTGINLT